MISALRLLCPGVLAALASLPLFAAGTLPDPATKSQVPPVAFIQAAIYKQMKLSDFTLTGKMRSDKTHKSYPITIRTDKYTIVYEFNDQPLQLRVQIDPDNIKLDRRTSATDTWKRVPASDYGQAILGADITYGDLAIDFIDWDDIQPLGTDTIKTLDAYVLDAHPGANDRSEFPTVRFWVSKQYWAFLRIDGLNSKGQTMKRVEVQNIMTVADKYTVFKEMKISYMAPDKDDIATSTTYIDIDEGKAGSGLSETK